MTRTLLAKEVRELAPLIAAVVLLDLLAIAEYFVLSSPDEFRPASVSFLLDQSLAEVTSVSTMVMAVFAAYLTYPREHDERTIAFLEALPVPRTRIFLAKFTAAAGTLIVLFTLVWIPLLWGLHLLDPNSITSRQFRWDLVLTEAGMEIALILIAVSHGMLIAYFRMFGILAALVAYFAIVILAAQDPLLEPLDPGGLYRVEHDGTRVIVPWSLWAGHAAAAAVTLGLSAFLWTRAGERRAALLDRIVHSGLYRTATTALATLAVVLTAVTVTITAEQAARPGDGAPEPEVAVKRTGSLEYRYLPEDEVDADMLASVGEERYERVRRLLGAGDAAPVIVDLTQPGHDHLGLASWKRLRIDVAAVRDDWPLALHVLDHELAHVVAASLGAGRLGERRGEGGILVSEGLADWVAFEIGDRPAARAAQHRLARLAWSRLDLGVDDLFDSAGFLARFDEYLVYPIGEAWVNALVATCGRGAPAAMLAAMARPEAPRRLAGQAFWSDTLQAAGCDLAAVHARLESDLASPAPEDRAEPAVVASLERVSEGRAVFTVRVEGAAPGVARGVWLRVRDRPGVPAWQVSARRFEVTGPDPRTVEMRLGYAGGERFEVQAGVEVPGIERPLFGRWTGAGATPGS